MGPPTQRWLRHALAGRPTFSRIRSKHDIGHSGLPFDCAPVRLRKIAALIGSPQQTRAPPLLNRTLHLLLFALRSGAFPRCFSQHNARQNRLFPPAARPSRQSLPPMTSVLFIMGRRGPQDGR
jgi:hypothetical protein